MHGNRNRRIWSILASIWLLAIGLLNIALSMKSHAGSMASAADWFGLAIGLGCVAVVAAEAAKAFLARQRARKAAEDAKTPTFKVGQHDRLGALAYVFAALPPPVPGPKASKEEWAAYHDAVAALQRRNADTIPDDVMPLYRAVEDRGDHYAGDLPVPPLSPDDISTARREAVEELPFTKPGPEWGPITTRNIDRLWLIELQRMVSQLRDEVAKVEDTFDPDCLIGTIMDDLTDHVRNASE